MGQRKAIWADEHSDKLLDELHLASGHSKAWHLKEAVALYHVAEYPNFKRDAEAREQRRGNHAL